MKKINLLFLSVFTAISANAQQIIDTVSTGAGYANQQWYSLANDEQGFSPKNNWDIAFETSNQGSSIHINSSTGVELWLHPTAAVEDFSTIDTTGLSSWQKLYNSNQTWETGAFNQIADTSNSFDLGWGLYSMITHTVVGNKVFIIKLPGNIYRKIIIESLAGGDYNFRFASIDNAVDVSQSITKSTYNTKNFVYFSLLNNQLIDREPTSLNWDITFTQYIEFIPSAYLVTGILHNKDIESVKVYPVADPTSYNDWQSQTFSSNINTVGYDWKSFNMGTFQWEFADSTVYFVKDRNDNIWKLIFTGFGGSSTGKYIFSKENITTVGVDDKMKNNHILNVFPNPATTLIQVTYNTKETNTNFKIMDLTGKVILTKNASNNGSLNQEFIDVSIISKGVYFLAITSGKSTSTQKIIIQ
ncbi:MAG: T9SS type A sorting domain-containing protein [Flavobacteriales bacterium]|nr:T9SS type A sorting domain-containing protein [Flavobacteriales bacterium]MCL4855841.1 T9SS type A sorting domain-containing protein [Flavobacteriales bacterium]